MTQFNEIYHADIYTTSGSTKLFNCWTENVDKYDTSSFYNWEQDNEPLYDLEERTYLNWEKLGFPTSCIPGLALVVSADAPAADVGCNRNIFLNLSSCIDALPKFIDFPVLIEVASYGSLGKLDFHDIVFGDRGSVEIINRNSYRGYSYVLSGDGSGDFNVTGSDGRSFYNTGTIGKTGTYSKYSLYNGISAIDDKHSVIPEWTLEQQILGASALAISTPVVNHPDGDHRFGGKTNVFIAGPGKNSFNWGLTVGLNGRGPTVTGAAGDPNVSCAPYENDNTNATEIALYDSSAYNQILGRAFELRRIALGQLNTNSRVYGNYLDKITVKNCAGPLYIRGFLINGDRAVQDGITIENSVVVLEGCASVLNNGNGFVFRNSDVTLTRGAIAYRNYLQNGGARIDGDWSALAMNDSVFTDETAGLKAFNSTVTVSSTSGFEFDIRGGASGVLPVNDMIQFTRNTNGISLINSVLRGGLKQTATMATEGTLNSLYTKTYVVLEANTNNGLIARGSTINLKGRIDSIYNMRGLDLIDSNALFDEFSCEANHREGLRAYKSEIKYNSSFQSVTNNMSLTNQWQLSGNGMHLDLNDSTFLPVYGSSMDANYGLMRFTLPHGTSVDTSGDKPGTTSNIIPSIRLRNGSKMELVHSVMNRKDADVKTANRPAFGSLVSVDGNSEAVFRGTQNYATRMLGPDAFTKQRFTAGVYANNNSRVEFTGPTVIAQFGVDVLADRNSEMSFNPPRENQHGSVDASSFNLSAGGNHTMVELHSTRACLVADNGSIINMEHLGDYQRHWGRSPAGGGNGLLALASGTDLSISADAARGDLGIDMYVSAGSMQFYPNPNDAKDYLIATGAGISKVSTVGNDVLGTEAYDDDKGPDSEQFQYLTGVVHGPWAAASNGLHGLSGLTGGGVCLRALHGSKVNVNNVMFPTGYWNPSSVYFDSSGSLCDRLFIWNIAQDSELHAAYVSVSAEYPSDAGYFGPSAVWEAGGGVVAYSAPPGTPDTSSLSVLDYFGQAPAPGGTPVTGLILPTPPHGHLITKFGQGISPLNQGPFRLFLSPDPVVNHMDDVAGNNHRGLAQQLYSQGYQPSGDFEVSTSVSSLYGNIVQWNDFGGGVAVTGVLQTKGFYYASAMLSPGVQIFLEESAANLFANAKHLATGKSGLAKKVHIYGPYTSPHGDSPDNDGKSYGRGYRSSTAFDLTKEN